MCGISGFIGNDQAFDYLMFCLKMLQNRGYDSAGLATIDDDGKLTVCKHASGDGGDKASALDVLANDGNAGLLKGRIGIGHTRWATHGAKTDVNSHPHLDHTGQFALCHNGIIENYAEIKTELINKHNITFKSQTDTEVIVNLISVYYDQTQNVYQALKMATTRLTGTWGIVLLHSPDKNKLYCARHGSPLLIGFSASSSYMMISSEQRGFYKYVDNYICLKNEDIVILTRDTKTGLVDFENMSNYEVKNITCEENSHTPSPYPHWTIKEINEQYDSSIRAMGMGGRILNDCEVRLGGLNTSLTYLKDIDHLILVGCGTSYNSGLYCIDRFKEISGLDTVHVFDGAEFSEYDIPLSGKTGIIFLSQSGETRDLQHCVQISKDKGLFMIGVINVVDSLIAREVNCGVYLNAGQEVAVASTKAFTSQSIVLNMIAVWFAQTKGINIVKRKHVIEGLRRLPFDIRKTIQSCHAECKEIAKHLVGYNSLFILGKKSMKAIADEGSLKIKEIGYIHAEAYSSSALKHGTYAIITPQQPVIIISPSDNHFMKNDIIATELVSRNAHVIGISDKQLSDKYTTSITIPTNKTFTGLLSNICLQLIAYELALLKGHNPDMPRNLAKVVTTD